MNDVYDDYRDLTNPHNFVNRTPDEQKRAALYFLQAGAIEALHSRVASMRTVDPGFVLDLDGADLPRTCLWQVQLAGASLRFANFDWSSLEKADLSGADLTGASLLGAVLRDADLRGATLTGADLRGADLTGAQLDGAILDGVQDGPIPPERLRENKAYREPAHLALQRKKTDSGGARPGNLAGDLSSHEAMERRDYSTPVQQKSGPSDKDAADDPEAFEKEMAEKRKEKKKEHQKWLDKKRRQEKFIAKKKDDQKQFEERKRQEEQAFLKKQREQGEFLARKRREEESRRR